MPMRASLTLVSNMPDTSRAEPRARDGAAKGIGRATAEQFARAGAPVALVDRDREALE